MIGLLAIQSAVASVSDMLWSLSATERFDLKQELQQELAIKIAEKRVHTAFGLKTAARHWVINALRDAHRRRVSEREYASGSRRRYKVDENWLPRWYPPHPDAREFAPFAMPGARVMSCKGSRVCRDVADAIVDVIDSARLRK